MSDTYRSAGEMESHDSITQLSARSAAVTPAAAVQTCRHADTAHDQTEPPAGVTAVLQLEPDHEIF